MPTTLPDTTLLAARARQQRRRLLAELIPVAVVIVYVLLLAWNWATLAVNFSDLFERVERQDQRSGEYNPMEPGHGVGVGANSSTGWLARR